MTYPEAIVAAVAARAGEAGVAVAAAVSSQVFTVKRPIHSAAVRKLWSEARVLARAKVIALSPDDFSFDERVDCQAVYDAITQGHFADFDTENPAQLTRMTEYFERLKAAGPSGKKVLTDEIIAATLALADVQMTGAELLGRRLDESDIANIRQGAI